MMSHLVKSSLNDSSLYSAKLSYALCLHHVDQEWLGWEPTIDGKPLVSKAEMIYLKLCLKKCLASSRVRVLHRCNDWSQLCWTDLSVSTCHWLQDHIMYEWVLLLQWLVTVDKSLLFSDYTHSSLDHLHTLMPHISNHSRYINYSFLLHLLQDGINGYECSCTTHSSTGYYLNKIHSAHFESFCYLQWTTMGPFDGLYSCLMRRWKARMGEPYSGTPWSGQDVKW